jgi:glycosyltransferase involved in cell wall biosynthesis
LKILQIFNLHRYRGGADNATLATVEILKEKGLEVRSFVYSSKDLTPGIIGKFNAFFSAIYGRSACRALERTLDEFQPDVVHVHKVYPLISPWVLPLCSRRNLPVVMSVYDYQLTCPVGTHSFRNSVCTKCLGGREYWGVVRNCRGSLAESVAYASRHAVARTFGLYKKHVDRFIVPTRFTGRWMVEHMDISADNVVTIPYMFDVADEPADAGNGQYVAYVGRFAVEKGLAILAEAARDLDVPFQLAGDAPELDAVRMVPNVEVVVKRTREELTRFYRKARMLVVPSLWFETLPLVIGEAMSEGIPVIASRIGGLPEIVEDGVTGLLFEPGNAKDLASKISRLWGDPALCRSMGLASHEKIRTVSHRDVFFANLASVYGGLVRT